MDREAIKQELERIREASEDGLLMPEEVVSFARDPATALHAAFTWDDTEAAAQYRLEQARRVIRITVEVIPQSAEPVRAYVSLSGDRASPGGGYRPLVSVLSDADHRAALLAQAEREFMTWRAKYQRLQELAPVFAAMDQLARRRERRRARRPQRAEGRP